MNLIDFLLITDDLRLSELAKKLEMSIPYLCQLRSGERQMNDSVRFKVCQYKKLTVEELRKIEEKLNGKD